VNEGGPAAVDGKLAVGDRIVSVSICCDDVIMQKKTTQHIQKLIDTVSFLILRQ